MNVALAVVAGVTVTGAVLAVSARDARATVLGILVVFLAASLLANPWPSPLSVLMRIAAALLAARLLAIGLRGETVVAGTRIGWPAEALAGGAAAVVGYGSHGLGGAGLGPPEAQAAGFALAALAVVPLVTGRDVLRLGVGAILLVLAALLVRVGIDPAAGEGEQLAISLLTIGLGGAVAVIAAAGRAGGGLETSNIAFDARRPRQPDAHRPGSAPSGRSAARPRQLPTNGLARPDGAARPEP